MTKESSFKLQKWEFLIATLVAGFLVAIFYPELITSRSGPLVSDHFEQHYPWAMLLSQSVKNFQLPLWTEAIQSGFPIAAESQIGIFYIPNLILSFFLPLKWSYSYTVVLHLIFSGVGTYLYARIMKLSPFAAALSAFLFVFGCSYGGAYYNTTSLKTISWFPWLLFLFERYMREGNRKFLFIVPWVVGLPLVAGYLQVAIFTCFIALIYFVIRLFIIQDGLEAYRQSKFGLIVKFGIAGLIGCLFALPQIYMTFQLAILSNRSGLTEEYAYVGSMSPLALGTLLFPNLQGLFRGNCLYSGMFALFLISAAFFAKATRKTSFFRIWLSMAVISLFFALGQWSPLYIAFIKITHFYSFRTPGKFLIFFNFSLALMAGLGFQVLWNKARWDEEGKEAFKKALRFFASIGILGAVGLCCAYMALNWGYAYFERLGEWALEKYIHNRAGHPHGMEIYNEKLRNYLKNAKYFLSFSYPWSQLIYTFLGLHLINIVMLKKKARSFIRVGLALLVLELYFFSWADFRSDLDEYKALENKPEVVRILEQEKEEGQLNRIFTYRALEDAAYLVPSVNMLYGFADIGIYTPLVMKRYHESIGQLGNVNDSNFAFSPTPKFILERLALLSALGVSHIQSKKPLIDESLKEIYHDSEEMFWLYRNQSKANHAFFVSAYQVVENWDAIKGELMRPGFDPRSIVLIDVEEYQKIATKETAVEIKVLSNAVVTKLGDDRWKVETSTPGFFVLMRTMFPGWSVKVNGELAELFTVYGLFQGIYLNHSGSYDIEFDYSYWQTIKRVKHD